MSLSTSETMDILESAPSFQKGKELVKTVSGIKEMYGYEGVDYTKVDEKVLKDGLLTVCEGLASNIKSSDGTQNGVAGSDHNKQMILMEFENAIAELKGERAASASLIRVMSKVSETARMFEKATYPYTPFGEALDGLNQWAYNHDLTNGRSKNEADRNFAETRRVKQEDYIIAVENRVKDLAPKWEEKTRQSRLELSK